MTHSSVLSFSAPSGRFSPSDLVPTSKIRTASDEPDDLSIEHYRFHKPCGSVDIVANFLKQARNQVLSSDSADQLSKKLLDALVNVVLDECCSLPEERDWCSEIVSAKGRIVFLCFLLWSFILCDILLWFWIGQLLHWTFANCKRRGSGHNKRLYRTRILPNFALDITKDPLHLCEALEPETKALYC